MRSINVLAAAIFACGAGGFAIAQEKHVAAGTSAVSGAFGNTIVETYPDGRQARIWLKSDGTYTGEGRKHDASSGHWQVKSGQLCFHQSHPFAFGASYCTPIPKVGLGQPWQAKAFTGEEITVKVEPGHGTSG
ncbi:MAG TPA: hypothetical protein VGH03_09865 [Caulobacteraceae bacterium]